MTQVLIGHNAVRWMKMNNLIGDMLPFGKALSDFLLCLGITKYHPCGNGRYICELLDGREIRVMDDEGIGIVEGEEGFEEEWMKRSK